MSVIVKQIALSIKFNLIDDRHLLKAITPNSRVACLLEEMCQLFKIVSPT